MSPFRTVLAALALAPVAVPAFAQDIKTEHVQFARGTNHQSIASRIRGREIIDYLVRASAGQTMTVQLKTSNPSNYFNIIAPGADAALFIGSVTGNRFEGAVPSSGDYTLRVYLMRSAARRNESARYTLTIGITGGSSGAASPHSGDYADGLTGGPDFWEITGLDAKHRIDLRAEPAEQARSLGRYGNGQVLRNLGCRMAAGKKWCEVQTPDGSKRGWMIGRLLRESAHVEQGQQRPHVPEGLRERPYSATGAVPCAGADNQPMRSCPFGVIRGRKGDAQVWIGMSPTGANGRERYIRFEAGVPNAANPGTKLRYKRRGDLYAIRVGTERFEIPEAVVFGG